MSLQSKAHDESGRSDEAASKGNSEARDREGAMAMDVMNDAQRKKG